MYCRACGYDLAGLPAGACPECAQTFDPDDSRTFFARPPLEAYGLAWARAAVVTALLSWIPLVLLHLALLARWLWPTPWGAQPDDVGQVIAAGCLMVGGVSLVLVPLSLVATGALLVLIALCRRWRLLLFTFAGVLLIYASAYALAACDPANVTRLLL